MDIEVPPELSCPLCIDLVQDPVSTPCRHVFCRSCIARVLTTGHSGCPLCRRDIRSFNADAAASDAAFLALIAESMPAEVVARRAREMLSRLEVIVGNLYEEVQSRSKNSNKWTMYVTLRGMSSQQTSTLIEKVVYDLHPTFRPSVVTAHAPTFGICRFGWGTFTVTCQVHWNASLRLPPLQVDHYLVFDGEGGRSAASIDVDPDALERLLAPCGRVRPNVAAGSRRALVTQEPDRPGSGRPRHTLQQVGAPGSLSTMDTIEVIVGNRSQREPEETSGRNQHRWTMYVELPGFQRRTPQMIERVDYELHPAFTPNVVSRRSPTFELTRKGWRTFPVLCTIHWNPSLQIEPTSVTHDLELQDGGRNTSASVEVRAANLRRFRS